MTSSRNPSAGIWITVALVAVLVGYPLSSGPTRWILAKLHDQPIWLCKTYVAVYAPLYQALGRGPVWLRDSAIKYRFWWSDLAVKQKR
jgi:hypothetical protein